MRAVKSVSIDSERRVIITFLDGSTETLYPNCIWCDSEALRQLIKDLLEEKADAVVQTISNVTVATFEDGADEALIRKLLVSIEPIQEGEGDPSPENVRPISGRTGLTIYHSGADTSDPTAISVNWESEAGTVYGGTLDVVSGKLVVDRAIKILSANDSYAIGSDSQRSRVTWTGYQSLGKTAGKFVSDRLKSMNPSGGGFGTGEWQVWGSSAAPRCWISVPLSIATVSDFTEWLNDNPVQLVYEIANPITYQLTSQEITTLLGTNNIWADSGNILELEYVADTKLYIGESQSGTLGSGRQTISNADLQPVSEKTWEDVSEAYKAETVGEKTHEESNDERGE